MNNETWHYLVNTFDVATQNSRKLMTIVAADHLAKLSAMKSDPDVARLYDRFAPVYQAFSDTFAAWLSAKGLYKGETSRVQMLLDELSSAKLKQWNIKVQSQYLEGTPDYTAILPGGRTAFQTGAKDTRITELKGLRDRLSKYPKLEELKNDVDTFMQSLEDARNRQQESEQSVDQLSLQLEQARKDAAVMLYRNLGALMDKFGHDTRKILALYEVEQLRAGASGETEPFTGVIAPGAAVTIIDKGVTDDTEFFLSNTGKTALKFWTASSLQTGEIPEGIELAPGAEKTVTATDIGKPGSTMLFAKNLDEKTEGSYAVV